MKPPHRFPFELVDRADFGAARCLVTSGSWWLRGERTLTLPWVIEAATQAAARILAPPQTSAELSLAAIEHASLERPVDAGEVLELRVRLVGRHGALARVESDFSSAGARLGHLSMTLAASPGQAATAGERAVGARLAPERD